jgi:hypothetical protein
MENYFEDLGSKGADEAGDDEERKLLDGNDTKDLRRVFADGDDSVAAIDKLSSVGGSIKPGGLQDSSSVNLLGDKKSTSGKAKKSLKKEPEPPKSTEPEGRHMRTAMDPQQKKYMDEDIKRLTEIGVMRYNENGLFSFKRFMHLFILITRHSKEMAIKESRKVLEKRRVAFRLRNWKVYREIV